MEGGREADDVMEEGRTEWGAIGDNREKKGRQRGGRDKTKVHYVQLKWKQFISSIQL